MNIIDEEGDYTPEFLELMEYVKHFNVHYRLSHRPAFLSHIASSEESSKTCGRIWFHL